MSETAAESTQHSNGASRPEALSSNPLRRVLDDLVTERRADGAFPPGPRRLRPRAGPPDGPRPARGSCCRSTNGTGRSSASACCTRGSSSCSARRPTTTSPSRTRRTSTGARSSFGDLIPLLGDGLLTIDGAYHDRARRIMMPAFHREQIEASIEAMVAEAEPALERLRPGEAVDVYGWARKLAMRIAMRALLGLDPDDGGRGSGAAEHFERALSFYGTDYHLRLLRGPGSPWRRLVASREILDQIVYGEISRRRRRRRSAATRSAQPADRRTRRGRVRLLRHGGPRPGDDADVRRPRHLHLDDLVPALRARPPPGRARASAGRAGRGARRPDADAGRALRAASRTSTWSSTRRSASTRRPGSGRGERCAGSSSAATTFPGTPT